MYPYLRLGPFLLQIPALALLIGVWVSTSLAEKEAFHLKLSAATVNNLVFIGLASGLVGARLAYAVRHLNVYLANPLSLLALNGNTLAVFDGLMIGFAAAALYGWRKKLPFRSTLDALAPGLAAFMIFLGVAHFLNGDAFGAPADIPWSIYLWGENRHPSQVYETLVALGVFLVIYQRPLSQASNGVNFLLFLALSMAAHIFLEAFRGDSVILPGGFRSAQVFSLIVLAFALYTMRRWARPGNQKQQKERAND